jgi:hypothetical protein
VSALAIGVTMLRVWFIVILRPMTEPRERPAEMLYNDHIRNGLA